MTSISSALWGPAAGAVSGTGWNAAATPAAVNASGSATSSAETSRDAQIADLPTTSSELSALQSMALSSPAAITIPPPQLTPPPSTNAGNELVDSTSAGGDDSD